MSARPGWTRVAFGDVVRLVRERSSDPEGDGFERYVGLEHIEPDDIRVRRWGNVSDGTTFTNIFHSGQVLFGKRRAYQRKVAVADFDGVCSGDIYVLEPRNEHLLPELLPFICQTDGFVQHAVGTSAGSLSPRTNWESIASYEFTLPPFEEQQRVIGRATDRHWHCTSCPGLRRRVSKASRCRVGWSLCAKAARCWSLARPMGAKRLALRAPRINNRS
jgi:type I restriction enzyme, S subunit